MVYITYYHSPIGKITLAADSDVLIGLWIENQKYYLSTLKEVVIENENLDIFIETKKWLDDYFAGKNPDVNRLSLSPIGSDFRKMVWKILLTVPYGHVITYGDIAKKIVEINGLTKMSAQAVGNAVSHNPISIIIPCHRVIGINGNLTGYAGGLDKKVYLLMHEGVDMSNLFFPKK